MLLTRDRLDEIQSTFRGSEDEEGIDFILQGQKGKYPVFIIWAKKVGYMKEENDDMKYFDPKDFLKRVEGKELTALIWRGWIEGEERYDPYDSWEEFAKVIGITKMVVVSTKVPAIIAKRFDFFADEKNQSTASMLRRVVYDFVENEFKTKADEIMFREDL